MMTGHTIVLRPFERRHLEETRRWANDPELMRLLDRARPVSDVEHEKWFIALHDKTDCAYFAIETLEGARHIGNVWLWNIDSRHRRAELRILIGNHSEQGRGAGTEAISLLCRYGFERLNLHKIYAYVLGINERARHAFEKAGFILEGTLREDRWVGDAYTDVYLLGKLR
jgi:RimJ/RimL family protein N-acetyltransferase